MSKHSTHLLGLTTLTAAQRVDHENAERERADRERELKKLYTLPSEPQRVELTLLSDFKKLITVWGCLHPLRTHTDQVPFLLYMTLVDVSSRGVVSATVVTVDEYQGESDAYPLYEFLGLEQIAINKQFTDALLAEVRRVVDIESEGRDIE